MIKGAFGVWEGSGVSSPVVDDDDDVVGGVRSVLSDPRKVAPFFFLFFEHD